MKTKKWLIGWFTIVLLFLIAIGSFVYKIDPYFHYHKPDLETYYYELNNQRSQNDGISKHFSYNALVTGTSMTENFKTSEIDEIFGVESVKVPYSGGSYKEINDNLKIALRYNKELKTIIRGLDTSMFLDSSDKMREDLGTYPTYLYDENPFNDVKYLFNKDVIFTRAYTMIQEQKKKNFISGLRPFDLYSRWQNSYHFGINTVAPNGVIFKGFGEPVHLTDEEKDKIKENITGNVTSLANEYPEVTFYYFLTPYSVFWYKNKISDGTIYKQIEAEQYIIELILEQENIHLFSFSGIENIVTDINNYKDGHHYAEWINSFMLRCMYENEYRLTKENYQEYIDHELEMLLQFDYLSLNEQEDYTNDYYSAALFNEGIWGVEPIDLLADCKETLELSNAEIVENQYNSQKGIRCMGAIQRRSLSEVSVEEYVQNEGFVGAKITVESIGKHKYLVFYGKKVENHGQPTVFVFDENNNKVGEIAENYHDIDKEWHQYMIDLSDVEGDITVYFQGGYIDATGSSKSEYIFSNIILY